MRSTGEALHAGPPFDQFDPDQATIDDTTTVHHRTHMAPNHTAFPFPRPLFEKFVRENNGRRRALGTSLNASIVRHSSLIGAAGAVCLQLLMAQERLVHELRL